ncbi:MAG: cytidylate kinase-like family protein [Acidobacteriota bacterium]|nr:cytidylate kinase-like family protein [Acidobacteriota bacterium]
MADSPHIERIIERQMKLWEVGRRLADEGGDAARAALAHLQEGPWVSVSRQLGSGGTDFARRLADRLGWQTFDHEILKMIAEATASREQVLRGLDEHSWNRFQDYLTSMVVGSPTRSGFIVELIRVVWGLARKGNAVLLGRGANWFLDPCYGLRIRVVAPVESREALLVRERGVSEVEARVLVARNDVDQAAFIRETFARDIDDPLGYDLVLNTGGLDLEVAVDIASAALSRKLN